MENHSFIKFVPGVYVIYLSVPKVASSSISYEMLMRQPTAYEGMDEHSKEGKALTNWRPAMAPHPNLPIFTFTRDPINKFLSYYRNKFVNARKTGFELDHLRRLNFDPEMTLEEVVKHMVSIPVEKMEHHAQPQYRIILDENHNLIPDFVGKVESIDIDWEYIQALSLSDFSISNVKNTTLHKKNDNEQLSESVISALARYYSHDFYLFDYSKPEYNDVSINIVEQKKQISEEKLSEIKKEIIDRRNKCISLAENLKDDYFLVKYKDSMKRSFNEYLIHASSASAKMDSAAIGALKRVKKAFMQGKAS